MQDFLNIRTVNDLNSALSGQRTITRQALVELDHVAEKCAPGNSIQEGGELELAALFKAEEIKLLRQYADLPTLTEFQTIKGLRGLAKEGGTFGTAAIVSEIILTDIRSMEPQFSRCHRHVMMLLLKELDNPSPEENADLIDTALRFMRIELKDSVRNLSEQERNALLRGMIRPLVEIMLFCMNEYGLVDSPDSQGYLLSHLGKRVMLHMFDSEKFIETVTLAHRELQKEVKAP